MYPLYTQKRTSLERVRFVPIADIPPFHGRLTGPPRREQQPIEFCDERDLDPNQILQVWQCHIIKHCARAVESPPREAA
jgi:hypothetical protein